MPLQVERLRAPLLTSLLIADAAQGRIIAASDDVRAVGVAVGDSLYRAQQKAPFAAVIAADENTYHAPHDAALAALGGFTDRIETVALGEFLLEWKSATGRFDSGSHHQVEMLERTLYEVTGLTVQIGVASHRFTAQQAARDRSDGILVVPPHPRKVARYLAQLPITTLPELPNNVLVRLRDFGIYSLGQLAELPQAAFARQFGGDYLWLHELARGHDPRPLRPDAPPLRLLVERRFTTPNPRPSAVVNLTHELVQALSYQLETQGYRAEALRLVLHYSNGQPDEHLRALKPPSADVERMTWCLGKTLDGLKLRGAVARVALVVYPMRPWHAGSTRQLSLFDAEGETRQQLFNETLGQVQRRYGERCVRSAAQTPPPEPVPVAVEADPDGMPLFVYLGSAWHAIVAVEEFWRNEGGWWNGQPTRRDNFRVRLHDGTLRNLFCDITGAWQLDRAWLGL